MAYQYTQQQKRLQQPAAAPIMPSSGRSSIPRRNALTARLKLALTTIVDTPFFIYGSRTSLIEDLLARRERLGISYIALPGRAMRAFGPVIASLKGK